MTSFVIYIIFVSQLISTLSLTPVRAPQNGEIELECNHGEEVPVAIDWWRGHGTSNQQQIATWLIGQANPVYHGQWQGRTEMTLPSGLLNVTQLRFEDDGEYQCRTQGNRAGYDLTVTGNKNIQQIYVTVRYQTNNIL